MKKLQFCILSFMALIVTPSFSQVDSEKFKPLTGEQNDFSTSRNEDIFVFENNLKLFENAISDKNLPEAKVYQERNLEIAEREIARAKINLADMEAGNTKYLDEWRKENSETEPVNIDVEINYLNDNIKSMEYRYKDLKKTKLSNLSDSRVNKTLVSDMKVILKNMKANLKYGYFKKTAVVEQLSEADTDSIQSIGAPQNQIAIIGVDSSVMADFNLARSARINKFKQEKTYFEDYLENNDYKSAKRTYKTLLQLMQEEIDANKWLKTKQDEQSNKFATINLDIISPKITQQQKIAAEAETIKISNSENTEFFPAKTIELLTEFEETFN